MSKFRRVVLDTNIVISRMIFPQGSVASIFNSIYESSVLLTSKSVLQELRRVAERKKFDRYLSPALRLEFIRIYEDAATLIEPDESIQVCRDPRDDQFLELAASGKADLILTGDQDLLVLHPWRTIPILTPAAYLESLK
jgi:putative PIN family toxin of toxin-antitoxin system